MIRDAIDPAGFEARTRQYINWLTINHYRETSVLTAARVLSQFHAWCEERRIMRPSEVTRAVVERYRRHLFYGLTKKGNRRSLVTQYNMLIGLRGFFRWLTRQYLILYNPTADMQMPRRDTRKVPKHPFTPQETEKLLGMPDVKTVRGLRDRALLETLYLTGIRRMEIVGLNISDVDLEEGIVFLREVKGGDKHMVPIGKRACQWIRAYLYESRPELISPPETSALFISRLGRRFAKGSLTHMLRKYVRASGINKKGSCHIFRHSCATHMLDGGADIRQVQAMLGHKDIAATQIYTHVAIKKLKEIHRITHPLGAEDVKAI